MRKLPQDFAFPLGLGSKRHQQNGDVLPNHVPSNQNHITTVTPAPNSISDDPRAPYQDLDTINL